jgi:ABC-type lipoprotein export system ATPase subunit
LELFEWLNDGGNTAILVTNEDDIVTHAQRVVTLRDERTISDERRR